MNRVLKASVCSMIVSVAVAPASAQFVQDLGPAPLFVDNSASSLRPDYFVTGRISAIAPSLTDSEKYFVSGPGKRPLLLDAIGRMGGMSYAATRDRFDLPMGAAALTTKD